MEPDPLPGHVPRVSDLRRQIPLLCNIGAVVNPNAAMEKFCATVTGPVILSYNKPSLVRR